MYNVTVVRAGKLTRLHTLHVFSLSANGHTERTTWCMFFLVLNVGSSKTAFLTYVCDDIRYFVQYQIRIARRFFLFSISGLSL